MNSEGEASEPSTIPKSSWVRRAGRNCVVQLMKLGPSSFKDSNGVMFGKTKVAVADLSEAISK
jgi:hypothetical protein